MQNTTGPYPLSGVKMPSWLIRFDSEGVCTSPQTRALLLDQIRSAPPTDIVVFSHGWNNDFGHAAGMSAELMRHFESHCAAHAPGRPFAPLFVGVLWPSIWLSFDEGPAIASGGLGGTGAPEAVVAVLADRLAAAGGASGLDRVFALLAAPSINDAEAAELARLIAPAFGLITDEGAAAEGRNTVAEDVLVMMRAMDATKPRKQSRAGIDSDDISRPAGSGRASPGMAAPQAASGLGGLDPRIALRVFSLYQMKDRAGTVGFGGVSALLRDLLAVPAGTQSAAQARIHAVGHSFGCKVLLSAICAQPLPRPVASLLLLQPAVSHLAFAKAVPGTGQPGGYCMALSAERVSPPIISTYSRHDRALHDAFHLAVRRAADLGEAQIAGDADFTSAGRPPSRYAALGGYGPRGAEQRLIDPMPAAGDTPPLPWQDAPILALDGSTGQINGHGDVTNAGVAWTLHQMVFR